MIGLLQSGTGSGSGMCRPIASSGLLVLRFGSRVDGTGAAARAEPRGKKAGAVAPFVAMPAIARLSARRRRLARADRRAVERDVAVGTLLDREPLALPAAPWAATALAEDVELMDEPVAGVMTEIVEGLPALGGTEALVGVEDTGGFAVGGGRGVLVMGPWLSPPPVAGTLGTDRLSTEVCPKDTPSNCVLPDEDVPDEEVSGEAVSGDDVPSTDTLTSGGELAEDGEEVAGTDTLTIGVVPTDTLSRESVACGAAVAGGPAGSIAWAPRAAEAVQRLRSSAPAVMLPAPPSLPRRRIIHAPWKG